MSGEGPLRLTREADIEPVCEHDIALIYKHSPRCGVSLAAMSEVRRFMEAEPTVAVYVVDVLQDRLVSRAVEVRFGVPHASPQAILLRGGGLVWNGSHRAVTAVVLAWETEALGPPGAAPT
jgi:bacillithiol system protein YtxJ